MMGLSHSPKKVSLKRSYRLLECKTAAPIDTLLLLPPSESTQMAHHIMKHSTTPQLLACSCIFQPTLTLISLSQQPAKSLASTIVQSSHSHATALKMIVCYLKGTKDKGMIFKPNSTLNLECWCNADFASLYKCDPGTNPSSVKLCGAFIITLSGVPLF